MRNPSRILTDDFVYKYVLFSGDFYRFLSQCDCYEKAEKPRAWTTSELLKNHDEVDNNAEFSVVREKETDKILRNHNNNNKELIIIDLIFDECNKLSEWWWGRKFYIVKHDEVRLR